MRTLVTGGAGYVGGTVAGLLAAQGHEPTVFDNLSHASQEMVPAGVDFIHGEVERIDHGDTRRGERPGLVVKGTEQDRVVGSIGTVTQYGWRSHERCGCEGGLVEKTAA